VSARHGCPSVIRCWTVTRSVIWHILNSSDRFGEFRPAPDRGWELFVNVINVRFLSVSALFCLFLTVSAGLGGPVRVPETVPNTQDQRKEVEIVTFPDKKVRKYRRLGVVCELSVS